MEDGTRFVKCYVCKKIIDLKKESASSWDGGKHWLHHTFGYYPSCEDHWQFSEHPHKVVNEIVG